MGPGTSRSLVMMALAGLLAGCAATRTVRVESIPPARVVDDQAGCLVCERTPCDFTFSRQTCQGLFDSSTGLITLRAVADAGRSVLKTWRTCGIESGQVLRFDFDQEVVDEPPAHHLTLTNRCRAKPPETAEPDPSGGGQSPGTSMGEGYSAMALAILIPVFVLPAVPAYQLQFDDGDLAHGLQWSAALEFEAGDVYHGIDAGVSWTPKTDEVTGRIDYRFWPVWDAGGFFNLGLFAGAFAGTDRAGPRAELRLRFALIPHEFSYGGLYVACAYEYDAWHRGNSGAFLAGLEYPINLDW